MTPYKCMDLASACREAAARVDAERDAAEARRRRKAERRERARDRDRRFADWWRRSDAGIVVPFLAVTAIVFRLVTMGIWAACLTDDANTWHQQATCLRSCAAQRRGRVLAVRVEGSLCECRRPEGSTWTEVKR